MAVKRVLLVDTSEEVRELSARLLKRVGIDVDMSTAFDDAVTMLRSNVYTVVAIDRMRAAGGDEAVLSFLAQRPAPKPVVIVTSPGELRDGFDPSTVDLIVSDPVDAHTFVGVILACVAEPPQEHHLPQTHSPLPFGPME
jgi:DNA-binding NtrC family response regulator